MVRLFSILVLLAAPALPLSAELTPIGAAAAVSGNVQAVAPGAVGRIVQSGKPLYLNDHVTTDGKGRLQVLLADETVFTLGPDSDMVLDEFVYDPATGAGKVSANISKGVFRFVTGKVARKDPEKMKVKLSVGTIGIRGTTVVGSVDPVNRVDTVILADNGMVIVTPNPPAPPPVPPVLPPAALSSGFQPPPPAMVPPLPPPPAPPVILRSAGFGTSLSAGHPVPTPPAPMLAQAAAILNALNAPPPPTQPQGPGASGAGQGQGQAPQQEGGQPRAGELSGQNTANLFNSALVAQDLTALADITGAAATQQQQQQQETQNTGNISTWEQMRAIEMGTYLYTAEGAYACTGTCQSPTGTVLLSLDVDFGARIYGSDYSTLELIEPGSTVLDGTTILPTNFNELPGAATIMLNLASGNSSNDNFDGSWLMFTNTERGTATEIAVGVNYNNGDGTTAQGGAIGTGGLSPQ